MPFSSLPRCPLLDPHDAERFGAVRHHAGVGAAAIDGRMRIAKARRYRSS